MQSHINAITHYIFEILTATLPLLDIFQIFKNWACGTSTVPSGTFTSSIKHEFKIGAFSDEVCVAGSTVGFLRNKGVKKLFKSAWPVLMFETDGDDLEDISGKGSCGWADKTEREDDADDELLFCDWG